MPDYSFFEFLSIVVWGLSAVYLTYRAVDVWLRQIRSYEAIPFPDAEWSKPEENDASAVGALHGAEVFGSELLSQIQGVQVLAREAGRLAR